MHSYLNQGSDCTCSKKQMNIACGTGDIAQLIVRLPTVPEALDCLISTVKTSYGDAPL